MTLWPLLLCVASVGASVPAAHAGQAAPAAPAGPGLTAPEQEAPHKTPHKTGQEAEDALPNPLRLEDVLRRAHDHRAEIQAARAASRAAEQRPAIVSSLEDPMVSPSIDHLPIALHGADVSLVVEQRFPLSGVNGDRRAGAEASARRVGDAPFAAAPGAMAEGRHVGRDGVPKASKAAENSHDGGAP